LLQGDFSGAWEEAKKTARDMWNDLTSMFAKKPIQVPVELTGSDGKPLTPGKTNFSVPSETGDGDSGRIPEVAITRPRRPGEFSSEQLADAMQRQAEALRALGDKWIAAAQARSETVMTQEELADVHQRRGDAGFVSREDSRRQDIARDLETQKLRAEERLAQLQSDRMQAEFNGDTDAIARLDEQIILQEQLLDLVDQTTVDQIRREERLQQSVQDFTDRMGDALKRMARDGEFTFESLRMALRESLFEAFVDPAFDAAMEALGKLVKGALKALFSGGFAEGGFVPPGQWAVVGERGPELAFGGQSGMQVFSNEESRGMGKGGDTFVTNNIRTADTYSFQRTSRQVARTTKRALQEA
jgi:hypothetical protein